MRGRSPCLELRGALGDTRVSDCWFGSVTRAKFRVSRAVATWHARTLSTATRLFTNSTDNCMANELTARTNPARKAANLQRHDANKTCMQRNTEDLLPLVFHHRSYERPEGRHAGMALTAGGYFGVKARRWDVGPASSGRPKGRLWSVVTAAARPTPMRFPVSGPSSPSALSGSTDTHRMNMSSVLHPVVRGGHKSDWYCRVIRSN